MIGYDYNKGFSTVTNRSQLILRQAMNQKWIKIVIKTIYPINARLMTLNCVFEWFFFSWSLQLTQVAPSTREVATRRAVRSLQRLIWWHDFPFGFVARQRLFFSWSPFIQPQNLPHDWHPWVTSLATVDLAVRWSLLAQRYLAFFSKLGQVPAASQLIRNYLNNCKQKIAIPFSNRCVFLTWAETSKQVSEIERSIPNS